MVGGAVASEQAVRARAALAVGLALIVAGRADRVVRQVHHC